MVCFIIVMYYKQLAEGYDDRYNFDILQKVGMDQEEVRGTIL
jgi:putative ABC transport system permease protein